HEEEMLVVLLAGAGNGRRRPGPADSVNLIANALLMRLRPGVPRSTRTVFWAVWLMALGAVLELVALATVVGTHGDLAVAITHHFPAITAAHAHSLAHHEVLKIAVGAPIAALAWLWLAWANGRGHEWARILFGVLFGLTSVSLLTGIAHHAAVLAPADLVAGTALWLVALVALALIINPPSDGHYRQRGDAGRSRDARRIAPAGASWN
ncbi:MAG: hypothetical protein ACRDPA_23510, partial [Solirubrobacteraceae bacterium]